MAAAEASKLLHPEVVDRLAVHESFVYLHVQIFEVFPCTFESQRLGTSQHEISAGADHRGFLFWLKIVVGFPLE